MKTSDPEAVFDYRALRLLMGLIAFLMPFVTSAFSSKPLSSISASYYTEAHDAFIAMLFVIGTLLWAYNGHSIKEKLASKVASLATVFVAVFPTSCEDCAADLKSTIHYGAAVTLFLLLMYFCFGPFRENTKDAPGKKGMRANIYLLCGWVMALCLLVAGISQFARPAETAKSSITYWTETVALFAFGIAWIVAGKVLPPLTDEDERLKLSLPLSEAGIRTKLVDASQTGSK